MSEKASSPESIFGGKHTDWLKKASIEVGSLFLGSIGGTLGVKALMLLGFSNPITLLLGWAVSALGARSFAKKQLSK